MNLKSAASTIAAIAMCHMAFADNLSFRSSPLMAGRASLTEDGFRLSRSFGTANFTPELSYPIEIVYESFSEKTGIFGFAWRSPQLESFAVWDKDGVLWTTPWGEKIKFRPKKEKLPKDAVKIAIHEEARKGRGYYAPYSDWEADTSAKRPESAGEWTFSGKRTMKGWTFAYRGGKLLRIDAPSGRSIDFAYDKAGRLVSVSQDKLELVTVAYAVNGLAESISVNGVKTVLAYAKGMLSILPKTIDGQIVSAVRPRLVSMQTADLHPETYGYSGNCLSEIRKGGFTEKLTVQTESLADRKQNIRSSDRRSKIAHTGKVSGRLVSDGSFIYSYGDKTGTVSLTDKVGRKAQYSFNRNTGVFDIAEFTGKKYTVYYFMRYDVAYLGKVRKVVDGRGRDVVDFRYDKSTGRPIRVRDRLGNDINLEWDASAHISRQTRRIAGSSTVEPVRSYVCDKAGNPVSVSELDEAGKPIRTTKVSYNRENRPVRISDGRQDLKVSYASHGRPEKLTDTFGRTTSVEYDKWNRPVRVTDADGIVTVCDYTSAGRVARIVRSAGNELLQSVSVSYDGAGRPVSYVDQSGRTKKFERDGFGRVVKEIFPDSTEVAYSYDGVGRIESVLDENRNKIRFGWDAFGLASRTTAANQLTDYVKDQYGLLKSVVSSQSGKTDRTIAREYDSHDRVTKITYGKGEVETFAYDARGRLARHTRGKRVETYSYDHFGRLSEKCEDGVTTSYAYNAYGQRTKRIMKDNKGERFSEETRRYDRYGRLVEISSDGNCVKYEYGRNGRIEKQVIDGKTLLFGYTKYGRLQSKTLLSGDTALAELKYWYGVDGKITARLANGVIQHYRYDLKGQLLAVTDADGKEMEQYTYDPAGNILEKTVNGKKTTYTYDKANQLVTATTPDGKVTKYAYDAAGRMVKEGAKSYRYGYLDKVLSVTEGKNRITYGYHVDGQLATVTKGKVTENFTWDGLALVKRGTISYVNEPHPGGGAPVASSDGGVMFNDILGTTIGHIGENGYFSSSMTAFGDAAKSSEEIFFTGKPHVDGLGHAFLLRNYRADLGKWPTADPLGYPDGWNQMAYGNNAVVSGYDRTGGTFWDDLLAFGIAFNDYIAYYRQLQVLPPGGSGGGGFDGDIAIGRSIGYDVDIRLVITWEKVSNFLNVVTENSVVSGTHEIWFNDSAIHVMGLNSGESEPYVEFERWFLYDSGFFLNFVEDCIPNMHRTSEIHDAWVAHLVSNGWSMASINVPTMVPAYMTALMVNLKETGKSLIDVIKEWVE